MMQPTEIALLAFTQKQAAMQLRGLTLLAAQLSREADADNLAIVDEQMVLFWNLLADLTEPVISQIPRAAA